MPHTPPRCTAVGSYCQGLSVTLRVAAFTGPATSVDHEATWLFGHTDRIQFGSLARRGQSLYAKAFLAVPCRFAQSSGSRVQCGAHGFSGKVRVPRFARANRRLGGDEFEFVRGGRLVRGALSAKVSPARSLPVVASPNPCATAKCRTADNTARAACCRDLQIEILCKRSNHRLEALVRSRKAPYLCKVDREGSDSLGVEMISACSYLEDDGIHCSLHGRERPDGRGAKPDLCFSWPSAGDQYHTGCVFKPR